MSEVNLGIPTARRRSVSQLTSFTRCGEAYRLERVAKAPSKPAAWFAHGTAVHYAIEEYEKQHRQLSASDAVEYAVAAYDDEIEDYLKEGWEYSDFLTGGNKRGDRDVEDRRVKVAEMTEAYIEFAQRYSEEWRIMELGVGPAVEIEFTIDFGGVEVLGYIDQIRQYRDGRIMAVDIKTGSRKQDSSFQLAVYAHAINQNLGVLPITGAFWEAKHQADNEMLLTGWSKELLDDMFKRFDEAERRALYVPNPGDACRVCGVREACRINGKPEVAAQYADKFFRD